MFNRKCSLCGGKLENGKCTLCGLDGRQTSSSLSVEDLLGENGVFNYSFDFEKDDYKEKSDSNEAYIYEYSFDDRDSNNNFSKQLKDLGSSLKKQIKINISDLRSTSPSENHPYIDQNNASSNQGRVHNSQYENNFSKNGTNASKGVKFVIVIFVAIIIVIFASAALSSFLDNEYDYDNVSIQEDFDMQVDNYSYAVDTLPESGTEVVLNLTQGNYLGGIDIPCGTYIINKEGNYGSLELTDYTNGVFAYVSLDDYGYESSISLENVKVYPTTIVKISGDVSLSMISPNSQPYAINKLPIVGGDNYSFTLHPGSEKRPVTGVYKLSIPDYEAYVSVTLTRASGNTEYYDLYSDTDYQSAYDNLIITSNCTVSTDGDVIFTKLEDYDGYTPDQIYQKYYSLE